MYDVLIVGGGIVGATIGRELSKYNIKLGLIEKNIDLCMETTKANSAIAHGGYDCEPGTLKAKLNVEGFNMLEKLSKELGFTFKKTGSMVLAFNDEDIKILEDLFERGKKNKVGGLEIIDKERIFELEDKVSKDVKKALYCSESGVLDPFNFTYKMAENAAKNGMEIFTETKLTDIEKKDDHIEVQTNNGVFKTKFLVNASGLFSEKLANMAGDDDFYLIPTKGVYRLLRRDPKNDINLVIFQTPTEKGKGVLVTKTYAGNTMIGPTSDRIKGKDDTITQDESLENIDELSRKSIPEINLKDTIRIFTGIRAKPNTEDFCIYPSKNTKGVIHAAGIESPGLVSSPAIAKYVRELLFEEGLKAELKKDFEPENEKTINPKELSKDEKEELFEKDSDFEEMICLCEQISLGEIKSAMEKVPQPKNPDGIKRRTRAGMGPCQGRRCGDKVRNLLSENLEINIDEIQKEVSGLDLEKLIIK